MSIFKSCKTLIVLGLACAYPIAANSENLHAPGDFIVTNEVINNKLMPITATINEIGNGSRLTIGGAFEPKNYRDRYIALKTDQNTLHVDRINLTKYDMIAQGALDGAEIGIYRFEENEYRLVRKSKVKKGGHHASGWLEETHINKIVPQTSFTYQWYNYNRTNAPTYFAIRAVNASGQVSELAIAPEPAVSPEKFSRKRSKPPQNKQISLKKKNMFNKLFSSEEAPQAPRDVKISRLDEKSVEISWTPPNDTSNVAGYKIYRSYFPPDQHKGYDLELEPDASAPPIQKGDVIILRKKFKGPMTSKYLTNRVANVFGAYSIFRSYSTMFFSDDFPDQTWQLKDHEDNTPVEDSGETYLELSKQHKRPIKLVISKVSGTDQAFYEVMDTVPYTVEFWAKSEKPVSVRFQYHNEKRKMIKFDLTTKWKKYTAQFTPDEVHERANQVTESFLLLNEPGIYSLDNFRIFKSEAPFLGLLEVDKKRIKESGISGFRTHDLIKTFQSTYDMEQLTNPPGVIENIRGLTTLAHVFNICQELEILPWLQIEPHMTEEEWQGFVEYIAAPFDPEKDTKANKPWAYKRFKQGRAAPWTDAFKTIYFEVGNETWNRLFRPWTFTTVKNEATGKLMTAGTQYGLFQEYVVRQLKKSPYWNSQKLDDKLAFVLGGWKNSKFGSRAAVVSPSSDYLTIADYNGGWDSGEGPTDDVPSDYFRVLSQTTQSAVPYAKLRVEELKNLNKTRPANHQLQIGTYEAGPGYARNGLNGVKVSKEQTAQQEKVMKSLAAGTATLDGFLKRAEFGFTLQNYFTYGAGIYWTSHAWWHKGGQTFPAWKGITLFNKYAKGEMLRVQTNSTPTVDLKAYKIRKPVPDSPLVATYAFRDGDRFALFVLSRKIPAFPDPAIDGFTPIKVTLPFTSAKKVTLYRMSGAYNANNLTAENIKIETLELSPAVARTAFKVDQTTGATSKGLPPAATYLYVFDEIN